MAGELGEEEPSTSEAGFPLSQTLTPSQHGLGASLQCVAAGSFNFRGQRIRPRQATCCGADSSIRPFAKQMVRKRMSRHSCGIRFTCTPRPRILGEENGFLWGGMERAEICSSRPTSKQKPPEISSPRSTNTNLVRQIFSPYSTRRWREWKFFSRHSTGYQRGRKFLPVSQRDAGTSGNSFPDSDKTPVRTEIPSPHSTRHWHARKFLPVSQRDTGAGGNFFPDSDKTPARTEILSPYSTRRWHARKFFPVRPAVRKTHRQQTAACAAAKIHKT